MERLYHILQFAPIWVLLTLGRMVPPKLRHRGMAAIGRFAVQRIGPFRNRALDGLNRVFPDLTAAAKHKILGEVGANTARTLSELLNNDQFKREAEAHQVSGDEGLAAIKASLAAGKGAIIVSGHYGQWEAIRHAMMRMGFEAGAVYKPNTNPYYEKRFLWAIQQGGSPIVETGPQGARQMVKHIRNGGVFALLPDQRIPTGVALPFLGHGAPTSLAAAEMALKYDIPLVPAYGVRRESGISVEFEAPIPPSTSREMMSAVNDSLSARVQADPGQWYWLHHRWERPGKSEKPKKKAKKKRV